MDLRECDWQIPTCLLSAPLCLPFNGAATTMFSLPGSYTRFMFRLVKTHFLLVPLSRFVAIGGLFKLLTL